MTQGKAPHEPLDVAACRRQFPALARELSGRSAVFFDGPAGSQVPQRVIDAIGEYLVHCNANHGGAFATSVENDELLAGAQQAAADFVGTDDQAEIVFGANMTTLTFAVSRAMASTWRSGDEVIVTQLDHDANVTPWVLAARDVGATVRHVEIHQEDCTLDLDDLRNKLNERTRLVAVGCASNAVGTINPVREICRSAHEVGAEVFLDAVHYAPHALIDVQSWDCDFLAASAYKFFGPHVGILWGRRERLAELPAYKVRPASEAVPDRWMTGTPNYECIAGTRAAIDYLADLGRSAAEPDLPRRAALAAAFGRIAVHEQKLLARMLTGLAELPDFRVWGIPDLQRIDQRVPTISITHARLSPRQLAERLAAEGIFVWDGNFYALPLTERLELEPQGLVRIGLLHYNTMQEVERLLEALVQL